MGIESQVLEKPAAETVSGGVIRHAARKAAAHDCPVCLVPHEEQIHMATLSIHQWLRGEVMRKIDVAKDPDEEPVLN